VKKATKRELIVVAIMISRMIGTPVFSDRTEYSVTTTDRRDVLGFQERGTVFDFRSRRMWIVFAGDLLDEESRIAVFASAFLFIIPPRTIPYIKIILTGTSTQHIRLPLLLRVRLP
jgi:hypothetical protein